MIKVKSIFSGWREVDREHAESYILHIYKGASALNHEKSIAYIKENVSGIDVEKTINDLVAIRKS